MELINFDGLDDVTTKHIMDELMQGTAIALREYSGECSHKWPSKIEFHEYARGFTSEIMPDCPICGIRASFSSPWWIVRIA